MANNKDFKVKSGIIAPNYIEPNNNVSFASSYYELKSFVQNQSIYIGSYIPLSPFGEYFIFGKSGTRLYWLNDQYVSGSTTYAPKIFQLNLSTAWDLSTASYTTGKELGTGTETQPHAIWFNSDGTYIYMVGAQDDDVDRAALSTAWEIDSAGSWSTVRGNIGTTLPWGGAYSKSDGSKLFIGAVDEILEFSTSSAFNYGTMTEIRSLVYDFGSSYRFTFNNDGTTLFVQDTGIDKTIEFTLTTGFNLSTATFKESYADKYTSQQTLQFYEPGNASDGVYGYIQAFGYIYRGQTSSQTVTLDLSQQNFFLVQYNEDLNFNIINPPQVGLFTLRLRRGTSVDKTITFPDNFSFGSENAPTIDTYQDETTITFFTSDGGTTYQAFTAIKDAS